MYGKMAVRTSSRVYQRTGNPALSRRLPRVNNDDLVVGHPAAADGFDSGSLCFASLSKRTIRRTRGVCSPTSCGIMADAGGTRETERRVYAGAAQPMRSDYMNMGCSPPAREHRRASTGARVTALCAAALVGRVRREPTLLGLWRNSACQHGPRAANGMEMRALWPLPREAHALRPTVYA
jgi:hypothetical protein